MKKISYLNAVLTVIAFCLLMITLAVTGIISSSKAEPVHSNNFAQIPLNADGSINVRLSNKDVLDVNIESCDAAAFTYAEPIEVKIKE